MTITEFPIQNFLYYFTQVRYLHEGQYNRRYSQTLHFARTNKLLITVSVCSYCLCILGRRARVYPAPPSALRAVARKINTRRTVRLIFFHGYASVLATYLPAYLYTRNPPTPEDGARRDYAMRSPSSSFSFLPPSSTIVFRGDARKAA